MLEFLGGVATTVLAGVVGYFVWRQQRKEEARDQARSALQNAVREFYLDATQGEWWLRDILGRAEQPHGEIIRLQEEASKRGLKLHMSWDIAMSNIDDEDLRKAVNELDQIIQQTFGEFAQQGSTSHLDSLKAHRKRLKEVARSALELRI